MVAALWATGLLDAGLASLTAVIALAGGLAGARAVRRARQGLRLAIEAEHQRVARIRAVQQQRLAARQEEHARQYRDWQQRRAAFGRFPQWFTVSLPGDIDRVDVAGGTLPGWSALLTMITAPRISGGGEVTVLDLTEGAVAADLVAVARRSGMDPLVWVLPGDLPRLDLGTGLAPEALADVLAVTVGASDQPRGGDQVSTDAAILERVLAALGADAGIATLTAALRALAEIGDPRADRGDGLLTAGQLDRIAALFGRGATQRVVIERAWALESRLRRLDPLASGLVPLPPSRLRVAWLDRRSGMDASTMLGTYLTVAMTHLLRQANPGRRWQHTLCVLGAERLGGAVIDRLCHACETSGTGLVIGYRSIPGHVAERLGRGNAAVAYMRLGNAPDAKLASEQIGTEHRFVLSQLTDTVGDSLTDTTGDSYTSTVGTADSVSDSVSVSVTSGRSRGRGRSRQGSFAPFASITGSASRDVSSSSANSDSVSVTEGINSSTSWGVSTSRALSVNSSLAAGVQRSREFLVEQDELQRLPPSAVIITHAGRDGRMVVLADANPAIITLPTATLCGLEQARAAVAAGRPVPSAAAQAWTDIDAAGTNGAREGPAAAPRPRGRHAAGFGSGDSGPPGSAAAAGHSGSGIDQPGPGADGTGSGTVWPGSAAAAGHPGSGIDQPGPGADGTGSGTDADRGADRPGFGTPDFGPPDAGLADDEPPPNLGPPPARLDWRSPR